jgi:hypothetical protein
MQLGTARHKAADAGMVRHFVTTITALSKKIRNLIPLPKVLISTRRIFSQDRFLLSSKLM